MIKRILTTSFLLSLGLLGTGCVTTKQSSVAVIQDDNVKKAVAILILKVNALENKTQPANAIINPASEQTEVIYPSEEQTEVIYPPKEETKVICPPKEETKIIRPPKEETKVICSSKEHDVVIREYAKDGDIK